MKAITDGEVSAWLASHGIQEAPYLTCASGEELEYEQARIPPQAPGKDCFVQDVLTATAPFGAAVLHITDWAHYIPQQMATIMAIRASFGENRRLIDAPGLCFGADESDLLAGMFALTMYYGWSAYLYLEKGPTFLNWEGELLDIWMTEGNREFLLRVIAPFKNDDG